MPLARPARTRKTALATLLALLILLLADGRPAPAHHTNVMQYVFQRVGEAKAGPFDVALTALQPKLTNAGGRKLSPAEVHKRLEKYTHRFKVEVLSTSPVPPPSGSASASPRRACRAPSPSTTSRAGTRPTPPTSPSARGDATKWKPSWAETPTPSPCGPPSRSTTPTRS